MNDETLQKNKIILQEKIREKYKDNEEEFFKDLQTTSQTFWKRYDNQKFPTKQIFKAKELLNLTKEEMLSIFFGETKISEKVIVFYNYMLKYIAPLTNEEKTEFLTKFSQRIDSLKQ